MPFQQCWAFSAALGIDSSRSLAMYPRGVVRRPVANSAYNASRRLYFQKCLLGSNQRCNFASTLNRRAVRADADFEGMFLID